MPSARRRHCLPQAAEGCWAGPATRASAGWHRPADLSDVVPETRRADGAVGNATRAAGPGTGPCVREVDNGWVVTVGGAGPIRWGGAAHQDVAVAGAAPARQSR